MFLFVKTLMKKGLILVVMVGFVIGAVCYLKGQNSIPELAWLKKEPPELVDLKIEQETYNEKEIVKKFFSDTTDIEKEVIKQSYGTWTEYSSSRSVKFGSWGDVQFKMKHENVKPVSFDKDEAEKRVREFLKKYTPDLGAEVQVKIEEDRQGEKIIGYKVVFTHSHKGVPILSDAAYAGDRIEINVGERGVTRAMRMWHKVTGNALEPRQIVEAKKALDEVHAKGHAYLNTKDFDITYIAPVYFMDWTSIKFKEQPILKPGWWVGVRLTNDTLKYLCVDGKTGKIVFPIASNTNNISDFPGKAIPMQEGEQ